MHKIRRFMSFVNIQAGEERLIGQLVLLASCMELTYVLVQSMAFGLFVSEHGPQSLPYSYILISIFAPLAAILYIKAGRWVSFAGALKYTLVCLGTFCLLTWLGLRSAFFHPVSFILPLLYQIVANLGSLIVWPLSGRVLTLGQAKRLFPLIVSGGWLSNILGGLLILPLVEWMGTPNLLLIASVMLGLALLTLNSIMCMPAAQETTVQEVSRPRLQQSSGGMFRNPYVLLIFAYIILWWGTFFFLDNIFADGVAGWFPDVNALTVFRGQVSAVTGILALISSTFLAGRVITRFGLQAGLLIEVVILMLFVGLLALNGSLHGSVTVAFFLMTFAKVANIALGYSVSLVAYEILYQPLSAAVRRNVQATADGIFQPIASGLAGVSILVLMAVWQFDYLELSYVYLVLAGALVIVILLLSKRYVYALSEAITKRRLGESTRLIADPASLGLLKKRLHDPHPGLVMYAFQKLEQLDPEHVTQAIPVLIQHPAPDVRREVYAYIERSKLRGVQDDISRHLNSETVASVKEAGLRALGAIADKDDNSPLLDALHQTDPHVLRGALVGLLKYQTHDPAVQVLFRLAASPRIEDRIVAAHVLGEIDPRKFTSLHESLLCDPELRVRLAAIEAAGISKQPSLYPLLLESSAARETSHAAAQALIGIGRDVLPDIEGALSEPHAPRQQVVTLCRVIGRIDPARARSILSARMDAQDSEVRSQILITLGECGYRATDANQVFKAVQDEVREDMWIYALHADLENKESNVLLSAALKQIITRSIDRLVLLASFVFDADSLMKAREALIADSPSQRAYALEMIENQLLAEWKSTILPLLEDHSPRDQLARFALLYPQDRLTLEERLCILIAGSKEGQFTDWVRACAIYTAVKLDLRSCLETIRSASTETNPLVQDTACWAIDQFSDNLQKGESAMLSTIEKVLILRTVDMFGQTPDNVLADVAELLEEVEVLEGESVFKEGDPGDNMYIIVDGRVRVHTADRFLNHLGESDVFGEMALLDPAPRLATVTAEEPTRLFRLDQAPFYQLMSERPEIATGIIRVLTRHLRKRVHDLSQLERRFKDIEFGPASRTA